MSGTVLWDKSWHQRHVLWSFFIMKLFKLKPLCTSSVPAVLKAQLVQGVRHLPTCQDGSVATMEVNTHGHVQQLWQNFKPTRKKKTKESVARPLVTLL